MHRNVATVGKDIYISGNACKKYDVPGDGDCFLHSISLAIFPAYSTGVFNNKKITRVEVVRRLRGEMLSRLNVEYKNVLGGELAEFGKFVQEASYDYLKELYKSRRMLGEETKSYLEHLIEKNIIVVTRNGIPMRHMAYDEHRPTVIVMFIEIKDGAGVESGHYNSIFWVDPETGREESLFSHKHPFIQAILRSSVVLGNNQ